MYMIELCYYVCDDWSSIGYAADDENVISHQRIRHARSPLLQRCARSDLIDVAAGPATID
jgi:hypothetical protein